MNTLRINNNLEMIKVNMQAPLGMIGRCPAMLRVFQMIRKVAATDVPVLITGASGTGKELVSQAVHQRSLRAKGPFVVVNCAAIPGELLESELFGHEKGAFTGAYRTVVGKVELANHGTLFLDELGELPLELQVKLLRFLQEYTFERVGGRETRKVDLRVISATNSDLRGMVAARHFRDDLYYRLSVVNIALPPLKDRGEDTLIMAKAFLSQCAAQMGKEVSGFNSKALMAIQTYAWPGNIRELINRIRRAVVMAEGPWVTPEDLGFCPSHSQLDPANGLGLKEAVAKYEARIVSEALVKCQGNVQMAAKILRTSRSIIYNLVKKYKL